MDLEDPSSFLLPVPHYSGGILYLIKLLL